jgi:GTPase SAR1 family protein
MYSIVHPLIHILDTLYRWLEEARQNSHKNMVIALVGNKKDLEHKRNVTAAEGEAYAQQHSLLFMEASAKLGDNVEEVFVHIVVTVLENIRNGTFQMDDEVRCALPACDAATPRNTLTSIFRLMLCRVMESK